MPRHAPTDEFDLPTSYARAGRRKSGLLGRLGRIRLRLSARGIALTAVGALCLGGLANALFMQKAPHPAPLFSAAPVLPQQGPAEPPPRPRVADSPAPVPARPLAAAVPAPPPRAAAPTPPLPVPAARPAADDIGRLLRADAPEKPASTGETTQVIAVQKALALRGFEVGKPDGMMGPATRLAIETFEKRNRLPVTGQVSPRLMRALGVQTAQR